MTGFQILTHFLRMRCVILLILVLNFSQQALAQPGPHSRKIIFRFYTPTGKRIYPGMPKYQVGCQDMGNYARRIPNLPLSFITPRGLRTPTGEAVEWTVENESYKAGYDTANQYFNIMPPRSYGSYGGGAVTAAFQLVVTHGRDTMRIYPPKSRVDIIQLDSIPFQQGTFHIPDFLYANESLYRTRPGLRVTPSLHDDWRNLTQPLPNVVTALVRRLPIPVHLDGTNATHQYPLLTNARKKLTLLRASGRKELLFPNRLQVWMDATFRYNSSNYNSSQILLLARPHRPHQLYLLRGPLPDSLELPPKPRDGRGFVSPGQNVVLDSIFFDKGHWYGTGVGATLRFSGGETEGLQYGLFRLYFPSDLTPTISHQLLVDYLQQQAPLHEDDLLRRILQPEIKRLQALPPRK